MPPASRPDLAQIRALLGAIKDDAKVSAAVDFVAALLPKTGRQLREVVDQAPQMAEAVAEEARKTVQGEARELDRAVSRAISGVFDDLLSAGGARVTKQKRLTRGSQSEARRRARARGSR
jgi:hypothetical protein